MSSPAVEEEWNTNKKNLRRNVVEDVKEDEHEDDDDEEGDDDDDDEKDESIQVWDCSFGRKLKIEVIPHEQIFDFSKIYRKLLEDSAWPGFINCCFQWDEY
ncbi:hypothetical protein Nepgr_018528 [Nepenthes gracilis]|uniref:Uncharacterized protein n=1 Tax=Nepenthes gracilis TaxID=150966 RepID=A0AAD3ST90_NEPGR|nr:hypothetical protein Nepgr_018528 [Nepenthes gracilis]